MKAFDLDGPIMRVLSKISDLLILNIITIICCIPIITAGAAFTAMHYCCLKLVRGKETSMTQDFFHSFKDNFKQSTIIWLIFLLFAAIMGYNLFAMYLNPTEISSFVLGGTLVIIGLVLFVGSMVFPIQAKFVNPITKTLRVSMLFSFRNFPKVLAIMLVNLIPVMLLMLGNIGLMVFPLILAFCFSAPGYFAAKLYNKSFKKAENTILRAQGIEPEEDDEPQPKSQPTTFRKRR